MGGYEDCLRLSLPRGCIPTGEKSHAEGWITNEQGRKCPRTESLQGSGRTAYCNTKGHYEAEMIKGVKGFCTWMYTDLNRDFYLSLWTNFKKKKLFVAPEGVVWSLTNSRKESVLKTTSRNWKKVWVHKKVSFPNISSLLEAISSRLR